MQGPKIDNVFPVDTAFDCHIVDGYPTGFEKNELEDLEKSLVFALFFYLWAIWNPLRGKHHVMASIGQCFTEKKVVEQTNKEIIGPAVSVKSIFNIYFWSKINWKVLLPFRSFPNLFWMKTQNQAWTVDVAREKFQFWKSFQKLETALSALGKSLTFLR